MPILCNYYLTYRCNAYCDFCHFGDHTQFAKNPHAIPAEVLRNIDELSSLGVRYIDFTGGEPLLHPDIEPIITQAKAAGLQTSITTNGLLYPKRARALQGKVDLLHFSLDSSRADEHDASRGIACFDSIMESIRIARELGEFPDILFTVTNENYHRLSEMYALCEQHNLVLMLNPIFGYFRDEFLREEALDAIESFARLPLAYLNPSFITLRKQGGNNVEAPLCKAVTRVIVISPENEILLPCYHHHFEKIPIGESLMHAYASPEIAEQKRNEGRHAFCNGCTINCYFEPSFAFPVNRFSIATVPSKIKYGFNKFVRQRFAQHRNS